MADQTVRTIYEAVVSRAQRNLTDLARDTGRAADAADKLDASLEKTGKRDVKPKIDLDIAAAEAEVKKLTGELEKLENADTSPTLDLSIEDFQARVDAAEQELDALRRLEVTPQVTADTERAERNLGELRNRLELLQGLDAEVHLTTETSRARAELDDAEAKLKALQGAKAEMIVEVDAGSAEESLEGLGDAAEDAGDDAGARAGRSLLAGLNSTPVVGALSGLVAAVGGYISYGVIEAILESVRQQDVFGARAGLDEATARKFGAAAGLAYTNAWGDSIEANMGTATVALENALLLPDSTGRDIQAVIEQLTAVSEILDVDVSEAAEAAGAMLKNGLARNAEEAFDIIIRGQQEGLNRSDDWIDTLREYGQLFESIGLSGAEAGGLIEQAMDAGARNSDVAADALKEFSIRAQDDSKATRQAFEDLGLNADKMGAAFAKGGDDAKKGLDVVLDALRGIEDPMARNAAGVALFGTMWEDMGNGAGVLAMDLDNLGDSWVNVGDTTVDAMQRMSDNSATALEEAKRTVTTAATNLLGGIAVALEEPIAEASGYISDNTAEIIGFLIDVGEAFFDIARAAVEFGAQTIEVMGDVAGSLDEIVRGIADAVVAFGVLTNDQDMIDMGNAIGHASNDMKEFSENSDGMADSLRGTALPAIDEAERKFKDFAGPVEMQARLNDAINGMVSDLDGFVAHIDSLPGGTITINGDTSGGEEAMNSLINLVAESDGTLTINGETVQAEDAVATVLALADEGTEITVTANTAPAESSLNGIMTVPPVEVPVQADTSPAEEEIHIFGSQVGDVPATVIVDADTYYGEEQLRQFQGAINDAGGAVTINGEAMNAQQALDALVEQINAGEGYVDINGTPVPAETALLTLVDHINNSGGTVEIDADKVPATLKTGEVKRQIDRTRGTIDVDADTSAAERGINNAARDRSARITVRYSVVGGVPQARFSNGMVATGQADGGRIASGLAAGGTVGQGYGMVPAPYPGPGIDNVLWPLRGAATGRMLSQPLAGGEWVINPVSSQQHSATLAAINAGASRAELAASLGVQGGMGLNLSQQIIGPDARQVASESLALYRHEVRRETPRL